MTEDFQREKLLHQIHLFESPGEDKDNDDEDDDEANNVTWDIFCQYFNKKIKN